MSCAVAQVSGGMSKAEEGNKLEQAGLVARHVLRLTIACAFICICVYVCCVSMSVSVSVCTPPTPLPDFYFYFSSFFFPRQKKICYLRPTFFFFFSIRSSSLALNICLCRLLLLIFYFFFFNLLFLSRSHYLSRLLLLIFCFFFSCCFGYIHACMRYGGCWLCFCAGSFSVPFVVWYYWFFLTRHRLWLYYLSCFCFKFVAWATRLLVVFWCCWCSFEPCLRFRLWKHAKRCDCI